MMPGLSGYDVCRRIRADPATALLPVVLVTSLDPQQERVKGIEAGADDFLSKPINQAELFARVRSLLRVKALQDEVKRQADALKEWNVKLEERVQEQVAQLDRLSQLKRFFSPPVADAIVSAGENSILALHRREICYVFVDLRGFTAFTDSAEPEEVQAVLHDYHEAMGAIITEYEGTLDRFAGDGILIFFNDPLPIAEPGKRAAAMALAMQERFGAAARALAEAGLRPRPRRSASPRASRRSARSASRGGSTIRRSAAWSISPPGCAPKSQPGQILIDRRARAALDDDFDVEPTGPLTLKGYAQPVPAFLLKRRAGTA